MKRHWWSSKDVTAWTEEIVLESKSIDAEVARVQALRRIADSSTHDMSRRTAVYIEVDRLYSLTDARCHELEKQASACYRSSKLLSNLCVVVSLLVMVGLIYLEHWMGKSWGDVLLNVLVKMPLVWILVFIYEWIKSGKVCHSLEFCLRLFLPSATCEAILGDLDEQFDLDCARFGRKRAQVLRACDLARSLWPFISGAVRKLVRCGAFASAVEWVRRHV